MTEPFIGQIQPFGFNFAPVNWAFCNGATLGIQQYTALFSLLGIQYGGNGSTTFQLPNFSARAAGGPGTGVGLSPRAVGDTFGVAQVTVTSAEMPAHRHTLTAFAQTDTTKRSGAPVAGGGLSLPGSNAVKPFSNAPPNAPLSPTMLLPSSGSNQPHSNQQPYLAVNFCIALQGEFPSFS
jgi:microcystin-dependent protein